ncbi:MAG: radical SAM protein [Nitrospirae bacterium]|nr:radical SAM protein [Nitrospirota bacterium]
MNDIMKTHPCFSREAHHKYGRIHLPVAPECNIQCRYCIRKYDCANESRPGVSSRVLDVDEAVERVHVAVERDERIRVVGIAGPGDPLSNDAAFEVMRVIHKKFPELILCISTNGLLLPDKLNELIEAGLRSLTITINAVNAETAAKIYSHAIYNNVIYRGTDAADLLLGNQWLGLKMAVESGLLVKVNSIYIPGINDSEIPEIARLAGGMGASIMNITSIIPQAEFKDLKGPGYEMMAKMRKRCSQYISQMSHCRQCRADALGVLGEDRDMELEMLFAKIGDEYTEMIV